ncbi:MAG: hypothetical protein V1847_05065 [Candidatus Diapherotrites archaeon]
MERERFGFYFGILRKRSATFSKLFQRVELARRENPEFKGVLLYGGQTKKLTPTTDLDMILVGNISAEFEKKFVEDLKKHLDSPIDAYFIFRDPSNMEELRNKVDWHFGGKFDELHDEFFFGSGNTRYILGKSLKKLRRDYARNPYKNKLEQ